MQQPGSDLELMTSCDDIYGSIHYKSYTISLKCQPSGVNLDHAEKATTHIQTMKEWRKKKKGKGLTSVNCWGQIPTLSPSLASIQCSSTRRMTVTMSPCKPDTQRVLQFEEAVKRWEAETHLGERKRMAGGENRVCSPWKLNTQLRNCPSSVSVLQHVTSARCVCVQV